MNSEQDAGPDLPDAEAPDIEAPDTNTSYTDSESTPNRCNAPRTLSTRPGRRHGKRSRTTRRTPSRPSR